MVCAGSGGGKEHPTITLRSDGTIAGATSPNETSWEINGAGVLIFKHKDGRVSTTFDKCQTKEGKYAFEGKYHFFKQIVNHIEEIKPE